MSHSLSSYSKLLVALVAAGSSSPALAATVLVLASRCWHALLDDNEDWGEEEEMEDEEVEEEELDEPDEQEIEEIEDDPAAAAAATAAPDLSRP
ncbi:hypothetical protein M0804_006921 [Polistes exclamans]|nr:hypothetical protein M0804_006921 [Polistes exclamans]